MRCVLQRLYPRDFQLRRQYSSTSSSSPSTSKYAHLLTDLPNRYLPIFHDYLTPQPSHLLSTTLASFLPQSNLVPTRLPSTRNYPPNLPPSHHIIYFPSPVPTNSLLPDGTDTLHSPGPPFTRRLWAGGSIRFPHDGGPLLKGQRAVCVEGIRDVQIKSSKGEEEEGREKVFVGIERRIALLEDEEEDDGAIRARVWAPSSEERGDAVIVERRNLVFLQPFPSSNATSTTTATATAIADNHHPGPQTQPPRKSLEPPTDATYTITLTPTPALLFRYSALMFNAHTIHLDRIATRNVEHQPDLLVHGPLSLTLMIEALRHHLQETKGEKAAGAKEEVVITNIDYRNLQPLYCGKEMKICGKPRLRRATQRGGGGGGVSGAEKDTHTDVDDYEYWDVWIESSNSSSSRGLAVRGVVTTTMTTTTTTKMTKVPGLGT